MQQKQSKPLPLSYLMNFLPTHQSRQKVLRLNQRLGVKVHKADISQAVNYAEDDEVPKLARHILNWQTKINEGDLPKYLKNPIQLHANNLGITLKGQVGLYKNGIHTVGDALENPLVVARSVQPRESRLLMSNLSSTYGAISAAPSADELEDEASQYYDPSEEKNPDLKNLLDMSVAAVQAFVPALAELNYMTSALDLMRDSYKDIIVTKDKIPPKDKLKLSVTIRHVVSGLYEQEYLDLIKSYSDDPDPDNQETAKLLTLGNDFVIDVYVKYKKVGKTNKILSSFIKDNATYIQSFTDAQKVLVFKAKLYFVYEIFDRQAELATLTSDKLAESLKQSVLSAEKEQFRVIYGTDTINFFAQDLQVDTYSTYQAWIPTLCYQFGDDQVQKQFKQFAPCTCFTSKVPCGYYKSGQECHRFDYLHLFVDQKDNQIWYFNKEDEKNKSQTTYSSFFKRLGVIQCIATFSDPKYNTQQRVKSDKDKANAFVSKFTGSPEGDAVMMNVRSRSLAYYFEQHNDKFSFNIKYKEGNLDLFKKLQAYIQEPVLLQDVSHTLLPSYDNYSKVEIQQKFSTIYQEQIVKFQILNPDLTLQESEDMFQPIAVQMMTEYANKNTAQLCLDTDKTNEETRKGSDKTKQATTDEANKNVKEAITQMMEDLLKDLRQYLDEKQFAAGALAQLQEIYDSIAHMTTLGTYTLLLGSIAQICTKIKSFILNGKLWSGNWVNKFKNVLKSSFNKMTKALAVVGFALTFISVVILGGSMSVTEILGLAGQLVTMFGEFLVERLPRLVSRFSAWAMKKYAKSTLTKLLGKLAGKTEYIKVVGEALKIIGNLIQAVICVFLAYQASKSAQKAEDRGDYLARDLYTAASIIYIYAAIFFVIGCFPGAQAAIIVASVLMFIATILEALAQAFADNEVTSFLKWALTHYPSESKEAGLQ